MLFILCVKQVGSPIAYNRWEDEFGNIYAIVDFKISPDIISSLLTKSYFNIALLHASNSYNGFGMAGGLDMENTLRFPRNIKENHNLVSYSFKAALETVMCGCCWPAARIYDINPLYPPACPRCGAAHEDALHTFWTCPANRSIDHPHLEKSHYLENTAVDQSRQFPCLWLRGLLPAHYTYIPDEHNATDTLTIKYVQCNQHYVWDSHIYYGDASGGKNTSYSKLRRCGVGLVCHTHGVFHYGLHSNLPGPIQSVGRAELFAFVLLLRHLPAHATTQFVTDNLNVHNTFHKGPAAAANSANCN